MTIGVHGQGNNFDPGLRGQDFLGCRDTVDIRKPDIHGDDVRLVKISKINGFPPGLGFGDHFHRAILGDHGTQSLSYNLMVVGNNDPYFLFHVISP